jgi:hypothetical protein
VVPACKPCNQKKGCDTPIDLALNVTLKES